MRFWEVTLTGAPIANCAILTAMPKRTEQKDRDVNAIARMVVEKTMGEKLDGTPLDDPNAGRTCTRSRSAGRAA
jgi:hypothetical protein